MSKAILNKLNDDDHPGSLKDIMTAPPTSPKAYAKIQLHRTQARRSIGDKKDEQNLFGNEVM